MQGIEHQESPWQGRAGVQGYANSGCAPTWIGERETGRVQRSGTPLAPTPLIWGAIIVSDR